MGGEARIETLRRLGLCIVRSRDHLLEVIPSGDADAIASAREDFRRLQAEAEELKTSH